MAKLDIAKVTDKAFERLVGHELRVAREARGWSRVELVNQLPSGIGDRTLLSYEHGIRSLSVARLRELCAALGVAAADIVGRAEAKAKDLRGLSITVSLRAVVKDDRDGFAPIRQWARNRLEDVPQGEVLLAPESVREMASMAGLSHAGLAAYLIEFCSAEFPAESIGGTAT